MNQRGEAVVMDFGLSTMIAKPESEATTATGIRMLSTLRFSAPEILVIEESETSRRPRSKTPETDVWAFGMILHVSQQYV